MNIKSKGKKDKNKMKKTKWTIRKQKRMQERGAESSLAEQRAGWWGVGVSSWSDRRSVKQHSHLHYNWNINRAVWSVAVSCLPHSLLHKHAHTHGLPRTCTKILVILKFQSFSSVIGPKTWNVPFKPSSFLFQISSLALCLRWEKDLWADMKEEWTSWWEETKLFLPGDTET